MDDVLRNMALELCRNSMTSPGNRSSSDVTTREVDTVAEAEVDSASASLDAVDQSCESLVEDLQRSSGSDGTLSSEQFDVLRDPSVAAAVVCLYVIVILLGAFGSLLVFLTVVRTRQMWTATNVFIANLALTDLLFCAFDLPLSLHYQLTDKWAFGHILCHVIPTAFAVVVYSSALNLTMIAVDRYILIVCPLRRKMSLPVAVGAVVAIATVASGAALPIALYADHVSVEDPVLNIHRVYCTENWPSPVGRQLYAVLSLVGQFIVPLAVIAVLYYRIFDRLRSRTVSAAAGSAAATRPQRRVRTNKMLAAVVVIFAVSWTPFHVYSIVAEFRNDLVAGRYFKLVDVLCRVVAFSSSCINPVLYGWMNDNYRNAFLSFITPRCARPSRPSRSTAGDAAVHEELTATTRHHHIAASVSTHPLTTTTTITTAAAATTTCGCCGCNCCEVASCSDAAAGFSASDDAPGGVGELCSSPGRGEIVPLKLRSSLTTADDRGPLADL